MRHVLLLFSFLFLHFSQLFLGFALFQLCFSEYRAYLVGCHDQSQHLAVQQISVFLYMFHTLFSINLI
uniref:Uncharacterized protein n=1 Tax=Panstrongylus lignarius TaxID=156445 RepID=A0A224XUW1_9HEMI